MQKANDTLALLLAGGLLGSVLGGVLIPLALTEDDPNQVVLIIGILAGALGGPMLWIALLGYSVKLGVQAASAPKP